MDWTTLTNVKGTPGAIADWANSSRLAMSAGAGSTAAILVQEAEAYIYRSLRHWMMLTPPVTGTLTVGSDALAIPADMLEPDYLVLTPTASTGLYVVRQKTMQEVISAWSYDSNQNRVQTMPMIYYFNNTNIQFDSPPDQAYPYALVYYQQPAPLSASNPTNFLTSRYPRLLRCACMMQAVEWLKEAGQTIEGAGPGKAYWADQTDKELQKAQMESDRAKRAVIAGPILYEGEGTYLGSMYF